jgi:hypothetical protein
MKFTGIEDLPRYPYERHFFAIVKIRHYEDEFLPDIVYKKTCGHVQNNQECFIDYYLFLPSLDNKKDVSWQGSRLYLDWLKLVGVLPPKLENLVENWYTADEVEQHIIILEPEILYTRPTSDWHTWFDPTGKYGSEQIKNPFYQECNFELDGKKYYRIEEHNV